MKQLQSTINVIANAVENDTDSLRQLLLRNGVAVNNVTKDQLQYVLTGALQHSPAFREEFKAWVLGRSGASAYSNFVGDPVQSFGGLIFSDPTNLTETSTTSTTPPATTTTSKSFWNDITLNSILDFAKNGLNNYTEIVKSKTDKAIVDAAVEKERLNQNTGNTTITSGSGVPTWVYVTGVIAIVGGIGIYMYYKKK